mgnify:CR=1 FL=1
MQYIQINNIDKNGYFYQKIDVRGQQCSEYHNIDIYNLPISTVKDKMDDDVVIDIPLGDRTLYLKVWQICVGRIKLYLMDSDIEKNEQNKIREVRKHSSADIKEKAKKAESSSISTKEVKTTYREII